MFCMKCGKELPDTAAFCPWCGAGVTVKPAAPKAIPLGGDVEPAPAPQPAPAPKPAPQPAPKPVSDEARLESVRRAYQTPPKGVKIPLPTAPVPTPQGTPAQPKKQSSGAMGFFIRSCLLSLGIFCISQGQIVPGVILLVIFVCVALGGGSTGAVTNNGKVKWAVTREGLEITLQEPIDAFALSINDTWQDTASGSKIVIPDATMQRYVGELKMTTFRLVVAKIDDGNVTFYGGATLSAADWNSRRSMLGK